MTVNPRPAPLKVAIIGGGPGGLGAAIEFAKLDYVDWNLYEKKPQISETGGGISLQRHTWRLLELIGAAGSIDPKDYYRAPDGTSGQTRNGRTGKLLEQSSHPADVPLQQRSCRMVRAKLQSALLRNFVRSFAFPDHKIKYNGQSAYRTIIHKPTAFGIEGLPKTPVFWQNVGGKYVFTCPLGGDDFEVTARIRRPTEGQEHVSWGRPFDFSQLAPEYDEFCEPVRKVIQLAARGKTEEFALFSGPRLESVISHGALALIGDASHPLSGAFGAGAGFALEDVYALTRSVDFTWRNGEGIAAGLKLYDEIRSPHYRDLYGVLDNFATTNAALLAEQLSADEEIEERVRRASEKKATWMYHYEVDKVVDKLVGGQQSQPAALL
ncbi:Salicylate hydroxylase [Colletotrichum sidae]|uniref:Salicylate hydroxylase n=1 Tax=Colletotrichum sidae TaxID=1347389 RepID=A0A4V3I2I4_9PEZI|nr:Salicylate hydroxylase [Colletotrichum sidae]